MNAARLLPLVLLLFAGCADKPQSSPYVSLLDSPIRGLTPEEIESFRNGEGAGYALAAELNGYPGPKHLLDLAEQLSLTADQKTQIQTLFDDTKRQAQQVGEDILAEYEALDQGLRDAALNVEGMNTIIERIGDLEAQLRFTHLSAHLEAYDLVTPHQRAMYMDLRGYGAADHGSHEH